MKPITGAFLALVLCVGAAAAAQAAESEWGRGHAPPDKPFPPVGVSPLAISVIAEPAAVFVTDKRWYLVYEVSLLNVTPATQRVDRLDVLTSEGLVFASYAGPDAIRTIMTDAVRTFDGTDVLPASGGGLLFLDVPFERRSQIPPRLVHRLTTTPLLADGSDAAPQVVMYGAQTSTDAGPLPVLSAPLKGGRWVDTNGCCEISPHTRTVVPIDGKRYLSQRFAIDWVMIDGSGAWWRGDGKVNSNYIGYGEPVFAAASGAVVSVRNDVPENTPTVPPQNITIDNAAGNHVIVDMGDNRFATYAHLQPGSVRVRVGDRVHRGELLGKLGNSGSSAGPHLHFQVSDSASNGAATSSGRPYVLDGFKLSGRLLNEEAWLDQKTVVPAVIGPAASPTERQLQLPIVADIVVFP